MKKYLLIPICGVCLFSILISGCGSSSSSFKKGMKKFQDGEYELAIKDFEAAAAAQIETGKSNFLIAESYRLSNRIQQAIPYYKKALETGAADPNARFEYAYALKTTGQYNEAAGEFLKFIKTDSIDETRKERAEKELEILKITDLLKKKQSEIKLLNLPFNTLGSEFSPAVLGEDLVLSSSRKNVIYKNNGQPMLGLYKVKVGEDPLQTGTNLTPLSSNVFVENVNEGSPAFSPDGKTMVFARGNSGKKKDAQDVHLYMSRLVNGQWSSPQYLPINDTLSWDGSPAFSRDGKTLYFASNRANGFGGIDLYRTNMDASGRFSRPVNMGSDINTAGDEMFPYVAPDGKMYFSSDGHPGLGKLDIFVATRSQGVITVENLGIPFNTPQDDFGLVYFDDDGLSGFFASNREGGKGDDDIYYFYTEQETTPTENTPIVKNEDPRYYNGQLKTVKYYLAGDVQENETPFPSIDSVAVHVILPDTADIELAVFVSDKAGKFGKFQLEEGKSYELLASKPGYISKRINFSMSGKTIAPIFLARAHTDTTFLVNIKLDKLELNKTFVLENIYYDLDKYNIRPDAAIELDKLVQILKDNATVSIELSSHTDSRASESYNNTLSQRRAESAVNYLISKGIAEDRLIPKGYGESQLIIQNAKTEAEHQKNRRTEFTILSY